MRRFIPLLILLLVTGCGHAGTVSGHVFFDANANGQYDAGEPGAPGAVVSDGRSLAASAADGAYSLSCPDGPATLFVVNPKDTWAAAGFYRNLPAGQGTADFPLVRQEQKLPFYFLQGTDLHVYDHCRPMMVKYVQTVNSLPVPLAFVVHTGDLVRCAASVSAAEAERLFALYKDLVHEIKPPLFNLPGNHEHFGGYQPNMPKDTPGWGKALYRQHFGPTHYAFTYAGVQFIALDGTDLSSGQITYDIPNECLDWLKLYLDSVPKGTPLVLFIHEPINSVAQKAQVEALLAGHKFLLALSGHSHGVTRWAFAGGTEICGGATSYAWHGSNFGPNPMGYQVVKITGEGFESAMGDWAEAYPVTVTQPARSAILKNQVPCQVSFLDLNNEVKSAQVGLGEATQTVTEFKPAGLSRAFDCSLSVADLSDGVYDLTITLTGAGEPMVERQPFVVLTGKADAFTAAGPAKLRLTVRGAEAENLVRLNGQEIGKTAAGVAGAQTLELEAPASLLRRLNVLEFVSAPLPAGGCDDFSVDVNLFSYNGKPLKDPRLGGVRLPKSAHPVTVPMYFDATR